MALSPSALNKLQAAHYNMMYWRGAAKGKGDSPERDNFRRHADRFFAMVEMYVDPISCDPLDHTARGLRNRPRESA